MPEGEKPEVLTDEQKFEAIKDTQLYADALNAHGKLILEQNSKTIIGKAQGEAYGHVDAITKEILGIDRDRNIKTTDQIKGLLEELKTLRDTKGGEDIEAALKKQAEQYELQITKAQETISNQETNLSKLQQEGVNRDITSAVNNELVGKNYKAHYSKEDIEELHGGKMNKILSLAKIENGVIVHYDSNGNKRLNNKGIVMTTAEVVEADYSSMFEVKTPGGSGDPKELGRILESGKIGLDMTAIKTRVQFNAAFEKIMAAAGVASHKEEYNKKYKEAMLEYNYKDLPRN